MVNVLLNLQVLWAVSNFTKNFMIGKGVGKVLTPPLDPRQQINGALRGARDKWDVANGLSMLSLRLRGQAVALQIIPGQLNTLTTLWPPIDNICEVRLYYLAKSSCWVSI